MAVATIAALAIGGAGIGLQAKGQYQAGQAARANAQAEAEAARAQNLIDVQAAQIQAKSEAAWETYNAQIAEREATEVQLAAAHEERKTRKAGVREAARKRVAFGQAGVSGISKDLLEEEQLTEVELDALTIRRGGTVEAKSLQASAQLSKSKARASLLRGKAIRTRRISSTRIRGVTTGAIGTAAAGAAGLALAVK